MPVPDQSHAHYEEIFAEVEAPFAFVDLDAMWANAEDMLGRAGGKPIRIASKSIRCRPILERILARDERFQGLLTYTLPEALWLAEHGFDDMVIAYPTANTEALARLAVQSAANPQGAPVLMVDSAEHLELIESVLGAGAGPVRVCIDVDAGWWPLGGRWKIGPKRSPVHTVEQAVELAREIQRRPQIDLVGIMAYEGQIAGVGDSPPGRRLRGASIRFMQRRSTKELLVRRGRIVVAVHEFAKLEFVNGGGTGSIETTGADPSVTEIAAGSGLVGPALFDNYSRFTPAPAVLFALPVVRRPARRIATVFSGGYVASGPAGADRLPRPFLPPGLTYAPREGAGEVQTPLLGRAADSLRIGDRVWMRHTKAGELAEHFTDYHVVEGDAISQTVPTYRGEGCCFD